MAIYTKPTLDGMISGKPSPTYTKKSYTTTAKRGDSYYSIARRTGTSARRLAGANPRVRRVRAGQRLTVPSGGVQPQSYRPQNYALPQGVQQQIGQQQAGWGMGNPFRGGAPQNLQPQYNPYVPPPPAQRWGQQFVGAAANLPGSNQFRPNTYVAPTLTNVPGAGNLPQNVAQQVGQQVQGWTGDQTAAARQKAAQERIQQNRYAASSQLLARLQAIENRPWMYQQQPSSPWISVDAYNNLDYARLLYGKNAELIQQLYKQPREDVLKAAEENRIPNFLSPYDLEVLVNAGYDITPQVLLSQGYVQDDFGNWYYQGADLEEKASSGGSYYRRRSSGGGGGRGRYASSGRSSGTRGYMAGTNQQFNPTLLGLTSWRI